MITASILKQLAPSLKQDKAAVMSPLLDSICPKYGISTPDIFHEFIANLLHECMEFTRFEEGLNYSAKALSETFGRHRISIDDCNKYGRTPAHAADVKMIANIVYGGEWGKINLGNIALNDGYNFRGSGPIQMTGRGNISAFTNYINKKSGTSYSVEQMAELLRTNIEMGIHSACWLFAIAKNLIQLAIDDNMTAVVKKINAFLKSSCAPQVI